MKTIKINIKTLVLILGLMVPLCGIAMTTSVVAPQIVFEDDVEDIPAAPIDGLLGLGLAAGAYLGLRKKFKKEA